MFKTVYNYVLLKIKKIHKLYLISKYLIKLLPEIKYHINEYNLLHE